MAEGPFSGRRVVEELARMQAELGSLEPLPYIVLDHAIPPGSHVDGRDGRGRKYIQCSPSLMDAVARSPFEGRGQSSAGSLQSLVGMPVYLRSDLPGGWPGAEA
jgi:hypothetical protein